MATKKRNYPKEWAFILYILGFQYGTVQMP
jgi:hypothetical protein